MTSEDARPGTGLAVADVSVELGGAEILRSVDLEVPAATITALLGPSGCGKSTLLRVIAGLERAGTGAVVWRGRDLTPVPAHRRPVGLMFQDHALFPHRTVGDNVAFGLKMMGTPSRNRVAIVHRLLATVGLAGTAERSVGSLSGGEAQRVALARALAPEPEVLLLDEPLGSLDRVLRERLGEEIRGIVTGLGITAIHVTHDHDEAFSVADRLAVMDEGRIVQVGEPGAVRSDPADERVARFLGLDNVLAPATAVMLGMVVTGESVVVDPAEIAVVEREAGVAATVESSRYRAGRYIVSCRLDRGGDVVVGSCLSRPGRGEQVGLVVATSG